MNRRRPPRKAAAFASNVFINCPFDKKYYPLLRPLIFTIVAMKFTPRIALERSDSAENRLTKICGLIQESQFSVHDLSRLSASRAREFYRMNMPFELGVDYGARLFGGRALKTKRFLILESAPYNYQRALSDLSGVDIKSHANSPEGMIRAIETGSSRRSASEVSRVHRCCGTRSQTSLPIFTTHARAKASASRSRDYANSRIHRLHPRMDIGESSQTRTS